jgi:ferrous iron transport protein B
VKKFSIALVGNPNCGKTTVFNALTGARQKVGNWPGVTVEHKTGHFTHNNCQIHVSDLPGVYSLNTEYSGLDEKIARQFIENEKPDLVINIVDASNLNRHLLLTHELLDLGAPTILALNMVDVAENQGIQVDAEELERRLGLPVFKLSASRGTGLGPLKDHITEIANDPELRPIPKEDLLCAEESITHRFQWVRQQTHGVVEFVPGKSNVTERLDGIVLNRWLGIPLFLFMMYLMFTIAINVGAVFIDFFDILLGAIFVSGLGDALSLLGSPDWLRTIIADGIGGGIQLVGTFIPVIGSLYLCLSILEDSGYMARAAFVVDRLMARIGLPGNCFVPLIVGFGCNVPSVMASRSLTREQDRLLTIAMSPFMSCGARLTVYALFAAAFFSDSGSLIVFALYLFGIIMAVFTGWIFRKTLFDGQASPSIQEMPAYHAPVFRNIALTTWHRLMGFVKRAGITIIKVVTLLTVINSVGLDGSFGNQNSQNSVLSVVGKSLTPILMPIGIERENWPATVGVFTGIFAKEAVVGTLDALYQDVAGENNDEEPTHFGEQLAAAFSSIVINAKDLASSLGDPLGLGSVNQGYEEQGVSNTGLVAMQSLFTNRYSAFCYLVLILLYTPCVAVMGAMNRESGPYWASLVIGWSSFLAYWSASSLYQLSQITVTPIFSSLWLLGSVISMAAAVSGLKQLGQRKKRNNPDIIAST